MYSVEITSTEAAKFLGVNYTGLMKLLSDGHISAVSGGNGTKRQYRFKLATLQKARTNLKKLQPPAGWVTAGKLGKRYGVTAAGVIYWITNGLIPEASAGKFRQSITGSDQWYIDPDVERPKPMERPLPLEHQPRSSGQVDYSDTLQAAVERLHKITMERLNGRYDDVEAAFKLIHEDLGLMRADLTDMRHKQDAMAIQSSHISQSISDLAKLVQNRKWTR
jgi:excisionase family DNA binding protein